MNSLRQLFKLVVILWDRALRFLFGRDIFVSYSRQDAGKYAPALVLAVKAKRQKRSFYLDRWVAPSSSRLPRSLERHLRWSNLMVLVCTPNAVASPFVRGEARSFGKLSRKVISIDIDGCFNRFSDDPDLWKAIGGEATEPESSDAIETGNPSDQVVARILNAIEFTIQQERLQQAVWATVVGISLIIGGASYYSLRVIGDANAKVGGARKEVENASQSHDAAKTEAGKQQHAADVAREAAAGARADEKAARANADREEQIALARRLANDSDLAFREPGKFILSSLLAIESARRTPLFANSLALGRTLSLAGKPGLALESPSAPAFSPDGKWIAFIGRDRALHIRNAETGKERGPVRHPGLAQIRGFGFTPDGEWVVTVADDATVRIWDTSSQAMVNHEDQVADLLVISPNSNWVAIKGSGELRVWDLPDAQPRAALDSVGEIGAVSPDGEWLITREVGPQFPLGLVARDMPEGHERFRIPISDPVTVFISPDSAWIATVRSILARLRRVKLNGQTLQGIDFETETAFSSAIHKTISLLQAHLGERD